MAVFGIVIVIAALAVIFLKKDSLFTKKDSTDYDDDGDYNTEE